MTLHMKADRACAAQGTLDALRTLRTLLRTALRTSAHWPAHGLRTPAHEKAAHDPAHSPLARSPGCKPTPPYRGSEIFIRIAGRPLANPIFLQSELAETAGIQQLTELVDEMRTGRPPIPTELHKLRGTYRPGRHDKRAVATVTPGELSATAPSWMSPSQQEIWAFAVTNAPADLLKPIDAQVLVTWVIAADQHQVAAAAQNVADRGSPWPLLTPYQENLRISLYTKLIDQAAVRMIRASAELGFSPTSRPRSAAPAKAAKDDPEDYWQRFKAPGNAA